MTDSHGASVKESHLTLTRELIWLGIPVLVGVIGLGFLGVDVKSGGVFLLAAGVLGIVSGLFLHLFPALNSDIVAWERGIFALLGLPLLAGAIVVGFIGAAALF